MKRKDMVFGQGKIGISMRNNQYERKVFLDLHHLPKTNQGSGLTKENREYIQLNCDSPDVSMVFYNQDDAEIMISMLKRVKSLIAINQQIILAA